MELAAVVAADRPGWRRSPSRWRFSNWPKWRCSFPLWIKGVWSVANCWDGYRWVSTVRSNSKRNIGTKWGKLEVNRFATGTPSYPLKKSSLLLGSYSYSLPLNSFGMIFSHWKMCSKFGNPCDPFIWLLRFIHLLSLSLFLSPLWFKNKNNF